jgi:acylphosphatase
LAQWLARSLHMRKVRGSNPLVPTTMPEKIRAHIFVSGKVQGVWFREKTQRKAQELGVNGWVKNLLDGRVEAVFEGDRPQVEEMVKWAKKGPFWAKVNDLELTWEEYKGEFKGFEIKYDL